MAVVVPDPQRGPFPCPQDFGCAALVPAAQKFQGDERARKAFLGFQTACVMSMKKAALVREEQAKKGEDGGGS